MESIEEDKRKRCLSKWPSLHQTRHTIHLKDCLPLHFSSKFKEKHLVFSIMDNSIILATFCLHVYVLSRFGHVQLLWPHGPQPAKFLCPGNFPGKNTRVGCHALLQGILPTRDRTHISYVSCIIGRFFTTRPLEKKPWSPFWAHGGIYITHQPLLEV